MWSDETLDSWPQPQHASPREPRMVVSPICPYCGSHRRSKRQAARRALGLVGTLAGAGGSAVRAWRGAEVGGALGAAAGPPGMAIGAITGAVLSALIGGSTGCALGISLGEIIDTKLLDDSQCLDCGRSYSSSACTDD